jgi:DNA-binding transcriptional LysR family regulator
VNDRRVPDTDLEIRTLRRFLAVAEELSFTRAAERLFIAQQEVSREIQRLERRLGTPLFVRTTRRVTLTPTGVRLLDRARELVALHDDLVDDLAGPAGPVIIDLLSEGRLTGPRVLSALRAAAPDREFRSRFGGSAAAAIGFVLSSEIDLAVGRTDWVGHRPQVGLIHRVIRYEPLALLLPTDHPLARLDQVAVDRLRGLEIDANPARPDAAEWLDLAGQFLDFAGALPTPPHVSAVGLDDQAHHLIQQGLPILTAIDHVDVPGGVVRALVDPVAIFPWSICWRRGLRRDVEEAIDAAVALLTGGTDWLDVPPGAWLPEPEASRRRPGGPDFDR